MLITSAGDDMYTLGSISIEGDVSKKEGSASEARRLVLRYWLADPPVAEFGENARPTDWGLVRLTAGSAKNSEGEKASGLL